MIARCLDDLDELPRWVVWRNEPRQDDPTKLTKVPYRVNGRKASSIEPADWVVRAKAETAVERIVDGHSGGGVGIVLGEVEDDTMLAGVDLDSCINDGTFEPWAQEILARFETYAEVSPSGNGAKLFFWVRVEDYDAVKGLLSGEQKTGAQFKKPGGGDHPPGFEIYFWGRYFAVTKQRLEGTPDELVTIGVDDLRWLLIEAGTALKGNGTQKAERGSGPRDQSRSGAAFRLGLRMQQAGKSFEEFCEAVRSDPVTADWYREKGVAHDARELVRVWDRVAQGEGVTLDDFYAYMPMHNYIFAPSRETWPAASVDARIAPVPLLDANGQPVLNKKGEPVKIPAHRWLDEHRAVEQMTWHPGMPELIPDKLTSQAGWVEHPGARVFNLYRGPALVHGDAKKATPWRRHLRRVFPDDHRHIARWLAHRVQRPGEKINHALVVGGSQGIGKDTLLEPVRMAVGPWNWSDIAPRALTEPFNAFAKSVILRITEAHDLGDSNRYQFYEASKVYTSAPPDVLRVNDKHLRHIYVTNVCGVIITTNHKTDGIYLPPDDRRHYVAWSNCKKEDFDDEYWDRLWHWYEAGGYGDVAAYLTGMDITDFNPKAPPSKTNAWWAIVDAGRAAEDADMENTLDKLRHPDALVVRDLVEAAQPAFEDWLRDRSHRKAIPHRLETCGYTRVANPDAENGLWRIDGEKQTVYVRSTLTLREQLAAVQRRQRDGPD